MKLGKPTKEFKAYAANLQRAIWMTSIGSQLLQGEVPRGRGILVYNPYIATISDLNILNARDIGNSTN